MFMSLPFTTAGTYFGMNLVANLLKAVLSLHNCTSSAITFSILDAAFYICLYGGCVIFSNLLWYHSYVLFFYSVLDKAGSILSSSIYTYMLDSKIHHQSSVLGRKGENDDAGHCRNRRGSWRLDDVFVKARIEFQMGSTCAVPHPTWIVVLVCKLEELGICCRYKYCKL
jgi:hypothetical protein